MPAGKTGRIVISGHTTIGIVSMALLLVSALSGRNSANAFNNTVTNTNHYRETDLLSNLAGRAHFRAINLKNSWGLTFFPGGPFWISDNNSGFSTVCEASGQFDFDVQIPLPPGSKATFASPTGIVANTTSNFPIGKTGPAVFIFSSEDGTISAWNGGAATTVANEVSKGAIYKGLALGNSAGKNFLYATDFHNAKVQVFDKNFIPTTVPGNFSNLSIPAGYAPFGIANLKGQLYVTYAKQDSHKVNDQPGPGNGFVAIFDTAGHLINSKNLISHGVLNSPWGVAIAPSNFGAFSNDLLVGNLGDGTIHAYDLKNNAALLGELDDLAGRPIVLSGLWALVFGDGSPDKPANTLFFTAGIDGQNDGLFGSLVASTDAPTATPTRKPTPTVTRKPTPTPTKKAATPTPTKKPVPTPTKLVANPTPTPYRYPY